MPTRKLTLKNYVAGRGQPILFLHGVYMGPEMWRSVTEKLTDAQVILADMPGHGQSPGIMDTTLEDHIEMVRAIIEELGLQKPLLVGHSWGGMVGLRLAVKHPSLLGGLVLTNTPLRRTAGMGRFGFHIQQLMLLFGFSARSYGRIAAGALIGKEYLEGNQQEIVACGERLAKMGRSQVRATIRSVLLEPEDGLPLLDKLDIPWAASAGKDDYVIQNGVAETITAKTELFIGKGAHATPLEDPDTMLKAINTVRDRL